MAKSVWEGHLKLSLVTCPVALYKATDPKGGVAFHLINPKTKSRIVQVLKDPTTGEELDRQTPGARLRSFQERVRARRSRGAEGAAHRIDACARARTLRRRRDHRPHLLG